MKTKALQNLIRIEDFRVHVTGLCSFPILLFFFLWSQEYLCVECSGHQAIENQHPRSLHTLEWPMDAAGALQLHVCP